jgi:hypothetical protein
MHGDTTQVFPHSWVALVVKPLMPLLHLMLTSLMALLSVSALKFAQRVASCEKCKVVLFVRTPQSLGWVPFSCLLGSS